MRNTAIVSPPFGGLEKCLFLGKRRPLCRLDAPEGKNYGRGLWADCGRKNIGFLTPSGTVLGMKKRHRYSSYSVFHEIYLLWGKVSERSITNGQIGYVNRVVLFLNKIVV